ncbi:MAG: hypothetical protein COB53_02535 [Elusimicrobia bacterium]|nr:MAG: hypothetical protein COB53_02535 [Elusimicrobiota bacterium]
MIKQWTPALVIAALLAAPLGAQTQPAKKKKPKKKGAVMEICLWPRKCGRSTAKPPASIKPITTQIDPLTLKIMEMEDVPTAMRINGKIVYILPRTAIPAQRRSATATPDPEGFKTVELKTATAAQANEMSQRSSKIKGGSKSEAAEAFGDGSKSKT